MAFGLSDESRSKSQSVLHLHRARPSNVASGSALASSSSIRTIHDDPLPERRGEASGTRRFGSTRPIAYFAPTYVVEPIISNVMPWPEATMTVSDRKALKDGLLLHRDLSFSESGHFPYAFDVEKRRSGISRQDDMAMIGRQHEPILSPSPLAIARSRGPSLSSLSASASQGRFFGATIDGMATLASTMRPQTAGVPSSQPFKQHEQLGMSLGGHSSPIRAPKFVTSSSKGRLPEMAPDWEVAIRSAFPLITKRDVKGTINDPQLRRSKQRWDELRAGRAKADLSGRKLGLWDTSDYTRSMWADE